jgi:hypothetical protein
MPNRINKSIGLLEQGYTVVTAPLTHELGVETVAT